MENDKRVWASIATVERDTGLGKDTLRVWERRYGFPRPQRDDNGDRVYSPGEVGRLRLIKRLMDRGHRPGKLLAMAEDDLARLAAGPAEVAAAPVAGEADEGVRLAFEQLVRHDAAGLRRVLSQWVLTHGLSRFVQDMMPKLCVMVGEGWESGRIEVFEEHLFTEQAQSVLRQSIADLPPGSGRPLVLLTTVPEEQHVLGLLMLQALLTLNGVRCVSLGTQTPLADIVAAVAAQRADVVALSFSAAFPGRQVAPLVHQLRQALPADVGLWIGGGGIDPAVERSLSRRTGRDDLLPPIGIGHRLEDVLRLLEGARA